MKIVGIGGGTGLPIVLRGLLETSQRLNKEVEITAIVTTADDGGSTGRLRKSFGIPAVGDMRNCLVALAGASTPLTGLMEHRFPAASEMMNGHAFGNLFLTALMQQTGSLGSAVDVASELI